MYWSIHPGAVYMNQGLTYRVLALDVATKAAHVRICSEAFYTRLRDRKDVTVLARARSALGGRAALGRVQILLSVSGYEKLWRRSGLAFEVVDLHGALPPLEMHTVALWGELPTEGPLRERLAAARLDAAGGCHAISHALRAALQRFVLCAAEDIGVVCVRPIPRAMALGPSSSAAAAAAADAPARAARFLVYDMRPEGIGLLDAAFDRVGALFRCALALMKDCPCVHGCVACVFDPKCTGNNVVIDKAAGVAILEEILLAAAAKK